MVPFWADLKVITFFRRNCCRFLMGNFLKNLGFFLFQHLATLTAAKWALPLYKASANFLNLASKFSPHKVFSHNKTVLFDQSLDISRITKGLSHDGQFDVLQCECVGDDVTTCCIDVAVNVQVTSELEKNGIA